MSNFVNIDPLSFRFDKLSLRLLLGCFTITDTEISELAKIINISIPSFYDNTLLIGRNICRNENMYRLLHAQFLLNTHTHVQKYLQH